MPEIIRLTRSKIAIILVIMSFLVIGWAFFGAQIDNRKKIRQDIQAVENVARNKAQA